MICEETPPTNIPSDFQRGATVRDVLNRVIEVDIRSASSLNYKERNVLSLGFRSKRWHSELEVKDSMGIECCFVNTLHSFFMNRHWELALTRMGGGVFRHVLTRPVLMSMGSSYVQVRSPCAMREGERRGEEGML